MNAKNLKYTLPDIRKGIDEIRDALSESNDLFSRVDVILYAFRNDLDDVDDEFWILIDQAKTYEKFIDEHRNAVEKIIGMDRDSPESVMAITEKLEVLASRVLEVYTFAKQIEKRLLHEISKSLEYDEKRNETLLSEYKKAESVLNALSIRYNNIYNHHRSDLSLNKSISDVFAKISKTDDFLNEVKWSFENIDIKNYISARINIYNAKVIIKDLIEDINTISEALSKRTLQVRV